MSEEILLDVSELEAPEPLVETLAALEQLQAGQYLRMLHRRTPCLLYDNLAKRGFSSETRAGHSVACEVFIWRDGDHEAESAARSIAATLPHYDDL